MPLLSAPYRSGKSTISSRGSQVGPRRMSCGQSRIFSVAARELMEKSLWQIYGIGSARSCE